MKWVEAALLPMMLAEKLLQPCFKYLGLCSYTPLQFALALRALGEPVTPEQQRIAERNSSFPPRAAGANEREGMGRYWHRKHSKEFR